MKRGALCAALAVAGTVKYGSHVSLKHASTGHLLNSIPKITWGYGGQIVTGIPEALHEAEEDDLTDVSWIVRKAVTEAMTEDQLQYFTPNKIVDKKGSDVFEARRAGDPVRCGDIIRLEHTGSTEMVLCSTGKTSQISGGLEVAGLPHDHALNTNDKFRVECKRRDDAAWTTQGSVRLQWLERPNWYLGIVPSAVYNNINCPRCPMRKHTEVSVARHSPAHSSWYATPTLDVANADSEDDDTETADSPFNDEL